MDVLGFGINDNEEVASTRKHKHVQEIPAHTHTKIGEISTRLDFCHPNSLSLFSLWVRELGREEKKQQNLRSKAEEAESEANSPSDQVTKIRIVCWDKAEQKRQWICQEHTQHIVDLGSGRGR